MRLLCRSPFMLTIAVLGSDNHEKTRLLTPPTTSSFGFSGLQMAEVKAGPSPLSIMRLRQWMLHISLPVTHTSGIYLPRSPYESPAIAVAVSLARWC